MISSARPTRAEVTDVSHTVGSGTDAVMLSGDTAVGQYSVRAVAMIDRVARQTESYYRYSASALKSTNIAPLSRIVPFGDAIADAATQLVKNTHASAILVISNRGMTAATIRVR